MCVWGRPQHAVPTYSACAGQGTCIASHSATCSCRWALPRVCWRSLAALHWYNFGGTVHALWNIHTEISANTQMYSSFNFMLAHAWTFKQLNYSAHSKLPLHDYVCIYIRTGAHKEREHLTPYSYSEELLSKWCSNVVQADKPTRDKHCFWISLYISTVLLCTFATS